MDGFFRQARRGPLPCGVYGKGMQRRMADKAIRFMSSFQRD